MQMRILNPGTLFAGRYQVVACIAHGGMGTVYEAIHAETGRRCALKIMLPEMVQSAELRERFRLEARAAVRIESEFVVDVLDAGIDESGQMPFLVMEFLRGEELHSLLKRAGRLNAADVVLYLEQAASALDKAHRVRIVHRDLKPGNLFVTRRDDGSVRIKLLDFGIAKLVAETATGAHATRSIGTPMYMAPEQYQTHHVVSPATDIYALGMLAFTMLVGKPYWADEADAGANVFSFAAVAMHGPQERASVRAFRRGVRLSSGFDAWFAKITSALPAQRYTTAGEAISALKQALFYPQGGAGETALMAPAGFGYQAAMGSYRTASPPPPSMPSSSSANAASISNEAMVGDDEDSIATRALPLDFSPSAANPLPSFLQAQTKASSPEPIRPPPSLRACSPALPPADLPVSPAPLKETSPLPIAEKSPLETTVAKGRLPDIMGPAPAAAQQKQRKLATYAFLGSTTAVLGVALGASLLITAPGEKTVEGPMPVGSMVETSAVPSSDPAPSSSSSATVPVPAVSAEPTQTGDPIPPPPPTMATPGLIRENPFTAPHPVAPPPRSSEAPAISTTARVVPAPVKKPEKSSTKPPKHWIDD